MYPGIELRLLRYVVAVAEELHFTRAAERLHVAQPSLSKQIKDLETDLGVVLFERSSRAVRLTQEGKGFVAEAKEAVRHAQLAVLAAKAERLPAQLNVGFSPNVDPRLVCEFWNRFTSAFPGTALALRSIFTWEQVREIESGELDAGFGFLPVTHHEILASPLTSEFLRVAVSAAHPLAKLDTISLQNLSSLPLIVVRKKLHRPLVDLLLKRCREENYSPIIALEVSTFSEALFMVAEDRGFAFIPARCERLQISGVVYKQLAGNPLKISTGILMHKAASCGVRNAFSLVLTRQHYVATKNRTRSVAA